MVYQWKIPGVHKVDPQVAGAELERIATTAELTPENIVNESRASGAVLHNCFDWNDATAAESYRCIQAGEIVRNIVTVEVDGARVTEPVRAFVSIQGSYKPLDIVIKTADYHSEMYERALCELKSFQRKYSALSQLKSVFESIDQIVMVS